MTLPRITLEGPAPRTKKNSPVIVRGLKQPILLPSEAYREWLAAILPLKASIRASIPGLPIVGDVAVQALFYRDRQTGDCTGYYEALADAIQSDVWACGKCKSRTPSDRTPGCCSKCGERFDLKLKARGLGIIQNDRQIQHWDGSRLLVDSARPRIELVITTIDPPQKGLFPTC